MISYADRFGYLPVTTAVAAQAGVPAVALTTSVTAYLVLYGVCQPIWGAVSDRFGRRAVLIGGLVGLFAADVAVVLIPGVQALILLRAAAGAMSGALLPTTLAAVGDLVPAASRHRVVARLVAGASVAGALAMIAGGVSAARFGWRVPLVLLALTALVSAAITVRTLPRDPSQVPSLRSGLAALWQARGPAGRLYAFAFMEGAVMLGTFPLLVPALRARGESSAGAGTTMAAYGLAAVAGAVAVRRLEQGEPGRPVLAGGGSLITGLLVVLALPLAPLPVAAVSSACLGAAFSLFHARFQVMATQVAPAARGLGTGFFVGMVFTGAAVGTAAGDALAGRVGYASAFVAAAVLTVPVVLAGHRLARRSVPQ